MRSTKLTLTINRDVIEQAKAYASRNRRSISSLVESYLAFLAAGQRQPVPIGPITSSLKGIVHVEQDVDYRDLIADAVIEKLNRE